MSLSGALNSSLKALQANQLGLAVASNNIANANTPGYSRQRILLQSAPALEGQMSIGNGVDVLGIESIRDRILQRQLWQETSNKAAGEQTHQQLSDVETLFTDTTTTGMLPLITQFFNSFQGLSTDPTSSNLRQQVVTNASSLATFINGRATQLKDMQSRLDQSVSDLVSQVNTLAGQIVAVTKQISTQEVYGPANELRDQRAQMINDLSQYVEVHELESHGTYQLSVGNNRSLVFNNAVQPLTVETSAATGLRVIRMGQDDLTGEISGGQLGANIAMRDKAIPGYINQLDQLAYNIAGAVNGIHSSAYDPNGNSGVPFFSPLAAVANASRNIQVNAAIVADPGRIAASLQPAGTGNEAAIALGNLLQSPISGTASIPDQYRSLVFTIGSDTANAQVESSQHDALLLQLENRRQQVSGVSVDEETLSILQFQRAYQASARVVKTVDELLQLMLSLGQ